MGDTIVERVEVRRLAAWFDGKFAAEVTQNLLGEKYMRQQARRGNAEPAAIRTGYTALRYHLDYLGWLAENREWLAGPNLSLADFAAAAHLSCLDYIGDVDWRLSRTGERLVRADQVAAGLPHLAVRPRAGDHAARPLRRSRLLNVDRCTPLGREHHGRDRSIGADPEGQLRLAAARYRDGRDRDRRSGRGPADHRRDRSGRRAAGHDPADPPSRRPYRRRRHGSRAVSVLQDGRRGGGRAPAAETRSGGARRRHSATRQRDRPRHRHARPYARTDQLLLPRRPDPAVRRHAVQSGLRPADRRHRRRKCSPA